MKRRSSDKNWANMTNICSLSRRVFFISSLRMAWDQHQLSSLNPTQLLAHLTRAIEAIKFYDTARQLNEPPLCTMATAQLAGRFQNLPLFTILPISTCKPWFPSHAILRALPSLLDYSIAQIRGQNLGPDKAPLDQTKQCKQPGHA